MILIQYHDQRFSDAFHINSHFNIRCWGSWLWNSFHISIKFLYLFRKIDAEILESGLVEEIVFDIWRTCYLSGIFIEIQQSNLKYTNASQPLKPFSWQSIHFSSYSIKSRPFSFLLLSSPQVKYTKNDA